MNNYIEYASRLLNRTDIYTNKLVFMLANEFHECMYVVDTYRNMKNTADAKHALYDAACRKIAYVSGIVTTLCELEYISAEAYHDVLEDIRKIRESIEDSQLWGCPINWC